MAVGKALKPVPVPRLVPPDNALYQFTIEPPAQVADKTTAVPEHEVVLFFVTDVGLAGVVVTVTVWLVTRAL